MCALVQFELSVRPATFYTYYFALRELGGMRLRAAGKRLGIMRKTSASI